MAETKRLPPRGQASESTGSEDRTRFALTVIGCAYNEEANIGSYLRGCLESTGSSYHLVQVIIVASGCTDRTETIAREFERKDPRVVLIVQPQRLGKVSALREGLRNAQGDIVLIAGVDTVPAPGALEEISRRFLEPNVSLVCTRPVPQDTSRGFVVEVAKAMWGVHHLVSSKSPKAGEAYAIRNRPVNFPDGIWDDDMYIESQVVGPGARTAYASSAIFYNRVPTTPSDYLRQRWRIGHQEMNLKRSMGIDLPTWKPSLLISAVWEYWRETRRSSPYVLALVGSEAVARAGALITARLSKQTLTKWDPIRSTKTG